MEGQKIKIRLIKLHLTHRWLLQQLHNRGFSKLHEPRFSDILNEVYTGREAPTVIATANKVLDEYEGK